MKYPALRFRPLSICPMVAAKMPLSSRPSIPTGMVAVAIAKYAVSCGRGTPGNIEPRSGCVIRATIGGMNQTTGPMTNSTAASSAALRACWLSLTLR